MDAAKTSAAHAGPQLAALLQKLRHFRTETEKTQQSLLKDWTPHIHNQDFLPSAWRIYKPTLVDYGILLGSFGLFFTLVLLFARVLPVIATTEMKAFLPGSQPKHGGGHE